MKKNGAKIERRFFIGYLLNIIKSAFFVGWDTITSSLMYSRLYG